MDSILNSLFNGTYHPTPVLTKTQRELISQLDPLQDQVQQAFGLDFLDQMADLQAELGRCSEHFYFIEGFRLGAQLMLEALPPLTSARP